MIKNNNNNLKTINKFISYAIKETKEELKVFTILDIYDHFNQVYLEILNEDYNINLSNEVYILQLINKKYKSLYKSSLINIINTNI